MLIGARLNWRPVVKRRVRTGKLLHCFRAANSVSYVESASSSASHLTCSDAPSRCLVRKVLYWWTSGRLMPGFSRSDLPSEVCRGIGC